MMTRFQVHYAALLWLISIGAALPGQAATVAFEPAVATVRPGDVFLVALKGLGFAELAGGTLALNYAPDVLRVEQVEIAPAFDFLPEGGHPAAPGRWSGLGFDVFLNPPEAGDFLIATVRLTAVGPGTGFLDIAPGAQFFSSAEMLTPDLGSAAVQVVPVPAALILFGPAGLGVLLWRRRARA